MDCEVRSELHASDDAVRQELAEILKSPEFRTSKRCQDFLQFVVEQTLAGRGPELKERTIGVEAFGRSASYDTNEDGAVRIKATEVRRRLGLYYAGPGKHSKLRIDLPVGGYAPRFSFPEPEENPTRVAPPKVTRRRWMVATAGAIVALAVAVGLISRREPANVIDRFWQPVIKNSGPVLIAAAYVPVYNADRLLLSDQFVGGGDLIAATRVSGLLSRLNCRYVTKVGAIAFEDIRNAPTVLIGYSSDQWTAISSRLRFYVDDDRGAITDNGKPTGWFPRHLSPEMHTDEDYAVISRLFDRQTHAMLIEVTGITQYGTESAAEVVTDPGLLVDALKSAPGGWERKNLQLVLHMNVISNYPATPKVVASYYW